MNVLFDLGNVVVEWNIEKVINSLQLNPEQKEIARREIFDNKIWWHLDEGIITEEDACRIIEERCTLTLPEIRHCFSMARESLSDIPETIQLMQELKKADIPIYCLSNMAIKTYEFLQARPFFTYFTDIVISGFIKMTKPSPDIFHYTLNKFNLTAKDVFFIDDSARNIATAEKLGLKTLLFSPTPESYQIIRNTTGLPPADNN